MVCNGGRAWLCACRVQFGAAIPEWGRCALQSRRGGQLVRFCGKSRTLWSGEQARVAARRTHPFGLIWCRWPGINAYDTVWASCGSNCGSRRERLGRVAAPAQPFEADFVVEVLALNAGGFRRLHRMREPRHTHAKARNNRTLCTVKCPSFP
jgi:hypothetical protein